MKGKGNSYKGNEKVKDLDPVRARRERWKNMAVDLYLKGNSQPKVRELMRDATGGHSFSIVTINKYINDSVREWVEQKNDLISTYKAIELEKINKIEQTAWEAWDRSIGAIVTISSKKEKTDSGGMAVVHKNEQEKQSPGDPRFLTVMQWCVEQRCKILGMEIQNPGVQIINNTSSSANSGSVTNINRVVVFQKRNITAAEQVLQQKDEENEKG